MRLRQVRLRSSLSFPHDVVVPRLLTVTFTTTAFFSAAAYGCLRPPPDGRSRKACFHLSHSMRLAPLLDTMKPKNQLIEVLPRAARPAKVLWRWVQVGLPLCLKPDKNRLLRRTSR